MKRDHALYFYQRGIITYLKEPHPQRPYFFTQDEILKLSISLACENTTSRFAEKRNTIQSVHKEITHPKPETWGEYLHRVKAALDRENKHQK